VVCVPAVRYTRVSVQKRESLKDTRFRIEDLGFQRQGLGFRLCDMGSKLRT